MSNQRMSLEMFSQSTMRFSLVGAWKARPASLIC